MPLARHALQAGADANLKDAFGRSLLHLAAERGFRGVCEQLVESGAELNYSPGAHLHTLLHTATITGNYGMASILLDLGANPNAQTSYGATALHFALKTDQQYLAQRLIEIGADIDLKDKNDVTPRQLMLKSGFTNLLKESRTRQMPSTSFQNQQCASR